MVQLGSLSGLMREYPEHPEVSPPASGQGLCLAKGQSRAQEW